MAKTPKKGKRFRYNLEKVLKFRNTKETLEQEQFNKDQQAFLEEQEKERKIKAFQQEKYDELAQGIGEGKTIDFHQVKLRKAHLEIVKQDVEKQEVAREEAEEKKEKQRDILIEAKKDKQILEKDRDKKKDRWQLFMRREEDKDLNEMATQRYLKKRLEEEDDALKARMQEERKRKGIGS